MTYNFLGCDRDQPFLLPPDLRDWLPRAHLAWFILDAVDQLDLAPFYRAHRDDGHGHPAYDPKLLLGVLLYGYCLGVRSSRQLERRCQEDLAFRVLAANQTPDHVTIARFRARHEQALAGFLLQSLKLCAAAGMVRLGTVALDGTKLAGNASEKANRTHDKIKEEVAEILRQAAEIDQREDRLFGDARGDELPPELASKADRLARLRQAKAQLEAEAAAREQAYQQRVAAHTAAAKAKGTTPRTLKRRPQEAPNPKATANATDPDSRFLHTRNGTVQGYNAQAVTTMHQLVVAAELTDEANDVHQLEPMLKATATTLTAAGIDDRPEAALADSGYWSIDNLTTIPDAPELLIPPARHARHGKPRKDGKPSESRSDGLRAAMTAKLKSEDGKARYAKRRETIEPVFGQIKEHQGARRFMRRGRRACNAEWKLLCGTHNLLKLWRHTATQPATKPVPPNRPPGGSSGPPPAPSTSHPSRRPRLESARGPSATWWRVHSATACYHGGGQIG